MVASNRLISRENVLGAPIKALLGTKTRSCAFASAPGTPEGGQGTALAYSAGGHRSFAVGALRRAPELSDYQAFCGRAPSARSLGTFASAPGKRRAQVPACA
jgi:hypothetical protein